MTALNPRQKAAHVIISLGADVASGIFKHLKEDDIEKVTYEITRQDVVMPRLSEQVVEEFYGLCVAQKVYLEGGVSYAKNVLEKAFGVQQGTALLDRVTKTMRTKAFEFIRKADYKNLMNMIINEHPQTIALILSYARADQASAIISELPMEVGLDVIERIAKMDRTSPGIIRQVEHILESRFAAVEAVDLLDVGGINYIAEIINNIDRGKEKMIFDELNIRDPKLSEEIRKRMFVFED
ncbi:MAG: flagellar motor switch protein FliG, partial [Erysipelotrichales bacterium]